MSAADIVSWTIPFINQLSPIILIICIIAAAGSIIGLIFDSVIQSKRW